MTRVFEKLIAMPLWLHGLGLIAAFVVFGRVQAVLDSSYAASGHPVDYATGQTTFDAGKIKGFYEVMQEAGTLGTYVRTQLIDFGFIAMIAVFGLMLSSFVGRFARVGSIGRKAAFGAASAAVLGACMDTLENAVSFVMLANPQGFADWLALPYSGFAVAKFALITLAMTLVVIAGVLIIAGRVTGRPTVG